MKFALVALLGFASAVRLHDCDGDADDHSCEVFSPQQDGMLDKGYERAVTVQDAIDTLHEGAASVTALDALSDCELRSGGLGTGGRHRTRR